MLLFLTLFVIGAVVYSMMREGLFTACCYLFGIVFSGMVAFQFWPPIANAMEDSFTGSFLAHCEDGLALFGVFAMTLGLCRLITNSIANRGLEIPPMISQVGGGCVGAVAGYLLAGFLVTVLQTLPWDEKFLGYQSPPTEKPAPEKGHSHISNKVFPPDQVWLKLMRRASVLIFESEDVRYEQAGSPYDDFTYWFAKYRRLQADGKPMEIPPPHPPPPAPKKDKDPAEPGKEPAKEGGGGVNEKKNPVAPQRDDP